MRLVRKEYERLLPGSAALRRCVHQQTDDEQRKTIA